MLWPLALWNCPENCWIGHQQLRRGAEDFGVRDTEHSPIELILRFVELQKLVSAWHEDRGVDSQCLPFAHIRVAHVDSERELGPGWLHLAVRKEQSLDNPRLLIRKRFATGHLVPLAETREEHGGRVKPTAAA